MWSRERREAIPSHVAFVFWIMEGTVNVVVVWYASDTITVLGVMYYTIDVILVS